MKKIIRYLIILIFAILLAFGYYYVTLPALNIHSSGFWIFILSVLVMCSIGVSLASLKSKIKIQASPEGEINLDDLRAHSNKKQSLLSKFFITITVLMFLIFAVGSLLSSPIINAKKYQQLLTVETRDFSSDIQEVDYNQIPLLDRDSSQLLGNRKMGSMVDMVSQFEVSDLYSQINYQGKPVRVSPLIYASPIKWLTNQSEGIPAYILIDMTTQNTECVKLEEGIKYSQSEYFNRNIYRHLRFKYPTYIFDTINFEIDEEGTPYWIAPVKKFNIGLFGGQTIGRVVLCNAITGETVDYAVEDVPTWVDRVYSADLLTTLYNYHGSLKHGFLNSVLGQKDCLQTTSGYNYLALDDDVWVYTGITSVNGDESNVGFVLMNQRTMETRFYSIEGATEESAMASAQGQVQNLGYRATFPLLLNIGGEPTYFIALKDNAGLVKKYAMVNIQKYQWVAIGDTVSECEAAYLDLLTSNGITSTESLPTHSIKGTISKMVPCVINGNTHYLIMLEGSEEIYNLDLTKHMDMIRYEVGSPIEFEYTEDTMPFNIISLIS
ncbi:MAG: CvpA family protein [Cellulosilyticum sp.]|nr:CvpA family protein [Cellulosilyticum sp.]